MADDLSHGETVRSGHTGDRVPDDINVSDYAMDYSKVLHSFFPDTIPDSEFLNSDDAARYFAELVTDVLNAPASTGDHAKLASHLYDVKNSEGSQQATARIARETPFASVAKKIEKVNQDHGPRWGAWLAGVVIPIVLPLSGLLGQDPQSTPTYQLPPIVAAETVTFGTTHSGQSLTITGPPYDVEVIINILRNMSPAAFAQLSQPEQHKLAQTIFSEMGKMHSQQSAIFTSPVSTAVQALGR